MFLIKGIKALKKGVHSFFVGKPSPGYEKEYCEKAKKLDVVMAGYGGKIRGHMNGRSPKEVVEYFRRLKRCTCGGEPKVLQITGMGELDTTISCKSCKRSVTQSNYDRKDGNDVGCDELALQKWNAGMTQEEIDRLNEEAWERKRLHDEDLIWKPVHPNNMPGNGVEGIYCLIFKKSGIKTYCCKWTIEYQHRETEPMMISSDSEIEAYILHMKRYFNVKGPLRYPSPNNHRDEDIIRDLVKGNRPTLHNDDINDYGDFVRAYRTLEEAKEGALARCGWQGLNRETVIKP